MAEGKMKLNPKIFGVEQVDPGYIYIIENAGSYKVGKSKNKESRIKSAKTWMPDMNLIGIKPFWKYSHIERYLHAGFSSYWYHGEWFKFNDDRDRDILVDGFVEFSDIDIDRNSVDFIYWFNGDGMSEFTMELSQSGKTLKKFLCDESWMSKGSSSATPQDRRDA